MDASLWFESVTGRDETTWVAEKDPARKFKVLDPYAGHPFGPDMAVICLGKSASVARAWNAGRFRVWSIQELSDYCAGLEAPAGVGTATVVVEIHCRVSVKGGSEFVEVSRLQAAAGDHGHGYLPMFQVASNFNCLEASTPYVNFSAAPYLTKKMSDVTQGPAAASGAAVSAIVRTHAAFVDPDTLAISGQVHGGRQVELLGAPSLHSHFPVTNGKVFWDRRDAYPSWPAEEARVEDVRVGLHCDARVQFVRTDRRDVCIPVKKPFPVVDQVFVAAMNMFAPGVAKMSVETAASKMRFLLDAAYKATYVAAKARQSTHLFLTLVGGGSFGNPLGVVAEAMARAHAHAVQDNGMPCLQKVIVPLFDPSVDPEIFAEAFRSYGAHAVRVFVHK
jgi:hypothetical protein